VAVRREHDAVPALGELVEAAAELDGVALRRPPMVHPEVEPFGELGEVQARALGDRFVERAERRRAGPAARLGQGLGLLEGLARAVLGAPGLREDDPAAGGEEIGGGGHLVLVEQERGEGLHPLERETVGDPLEAVAEAVEVLRRSALGASAEIRVGDQLAHRRDEDVGERRARELRRRHELADRLDAVAPVLEPDRSPGRAGEHVEDAASDGELASALDDVGARVAEVDQPVGEGVGGELEPGDEVDGLDLTERRNEELHRGERGCDKDERPALGRLLEAADRIGAAGRRLGRGTDALVRQGLPGGEEADPLGAEVGLQPLGQRLGLAWSGGDRHDRSAERPRECGDQEVLGSGGPGEDRAGALEQEPFERLRADQDVEQIIQGHASLPSRFARSRFAHSTNNPERGAPGYPERV
jgi:hypothetical protein